MWRLLLLYALGSSSLQCASAEYDETAATEFAILSGNSYCHNESLISWNCTNCNKVHVSDVKICQASFDKTRAFAGKLGDGCLLSFEGTQTDKSMLTDLEIFLKKPQRDLAQCKGCRVHQGYYNEWMSMRGCLIDGLHKLGCSKDKLRKVHFTGHSMGGSVAAIAMIDLEAAGYSVGLSYNFGMPRTGNQAFSDTFTKMFANRFYRITHHRDLIIQMPPPVSGYVHVGHEVFYNANVSGGFVQCPAAEDKHCSKRYHNWVFDDWSMNDHMHYMDYPQGHFACLPAAGKVVMGSEESVLV